MNLRSSYSPEELSDKDIMETVLGRRSVYLRGWGRSVSGTINNSDNGTTEPNQPSYQEIVQQLNEANNRLHEVFDILRHNNLMPPPSADQTSGANLEKSSTRANLESQDDR